MKYYYTDPLAAAWMAKYHGMWFDAEIPMNLAAGAINYVQNGSYASLAYYHDLVSERLYIHPNSLHLLYPQIGDFIEGVSLPILIGKSENMSSLEDAVRWISEERIAHIIQRNGTPFMWPEYEDD